MNRAAWLISLAALVVSTNGAAAQKPENDPPKYFTNTIGMKFVWIPPGSFLMGSPKEETGRRDNEAQHKVTLTRGFYLGVYTVTQAQWRAGIANYPRYHSHAEN